MSLYKKKYFIKRTNNLKNLVFVQLLSIKIIINFFIIKKKLPLKTLLKIDYNQNYEKDLCLFN